jgi:murein DD-endopeptidase MepM/ murein hydrolase activator NlpD
MAVSDDEGYSSEGYGNHVVIEHEDGSRSLYAHLTKVYVEEGDEVKRAQPLGGLGCTGHSTGTHLHFELYRNGGSVDPLAYLPKLD